MQLQNLRKFWSHHHSKVVPSAPENGTRWKKNCMYHIYFIESLRNAFWWQLWLLVQTKWRTSDCEQAVRIDAQSITATFEIPPTDSESERFVKQLCTELVPVSKGLNLTWTATKECFLPFFPIATASLNYAMKLVRELIYVSFCFQKLVSPMNFLNNGFKAKLMRLTEVRLHQERKRSTFPWRLKPR